MSLLSTRAVFISYVHTHNERRIQKERWLVRSVYKVSPTASSAAGLRDLFRSRHRDRR